MSRIVPFRVVIVAPGEPPAAPSLAHGWAEQVEETSGKIRIRGRQVPVPRWIDGTLTLTGYRLKDLAVPKEHLVLGRPDDVDWFIGSAGGASR